MTEPFLKSWSHESQPRHTVGFALFFFGLCNDAVKCAFPMRTDLVSFHRKRWAFLKKVELKSLPFRVKKAGSKNIVHPHTRQDVHFSLLQGRPRPVWRLLQLRQLLVLQSTTRRETRNHGRSSLKEHLVSRFRESRNTTRHPHPQALLLNEPATVHVQQNQNFHKNFLA